MPYQLILSHNFDNIPAEIFNFQRYFFNEVEHLRHQKGENDCYTFYWKNIDNQIIEGRLSVIIQNKIAFSPLKATFGGIEFYKEILEEDLFEFLSKIIQFLKSLEVECVLINSYPESYLTEYQHKILQKCLSKLPFQVKFTEQNYEIFITEKSFYETLISTNRKRILRNSIRNNFIFKEEINPDLFKIHAFIEHSRIRKNRPMTMNLKQMEEHFEKFSKNFKIFSVYDSDELMAVCVTVEINEQILYTLYPADAKEYVNKSPLTFLFSGIYEYCQQQKYAVLDLGIATDKGVLNEGLARFKQNIGGNLSKKNTYFLFL